MVTFLFQSHTVLILGSQHQADASSHKPTGLSGTDASLKAPLTWEPSAHPDHTATDQDNLVGQQVHLMMSKKRRPLKSQLLSEGLL